MEDANEREDYGAFKKSPPRYQTVRFRHKVINFDLFTYFVALIEAVPMA